MTTPSNMKVTSQDVAEATSQWHEVDGFLRAMQAFGVEIPASSRFWNYRKWILDRYPHPPSVLTPIRAADLRVFGTMGLEMRRMLLATQRLQHKEEWRALLRMAVGGRDLPSDGGVSHPRNHQFHAYVAALLSIAGLDVRHDEPDIVTCVAGHPVCCAVKRAGSERNLGDLFRAGLRQVRDKRFRGFVIMDVTRLVSPRDNVPVTADEQRMSFYLRTKMATLGMTHLDQIRGAPANLLGVILFATVVTFDPTRGCFTPMSYWWTKTLWPSADPRHRLLRTIHEALKVAGRAFA